MFSLRADVEIGVYVDVNPLLHSLFTAFCTLKDDEMAIKQQQRSPTDRMINPLASLEEAALHSANNHLSPQKRW